MKKIMILFVIFLGLILINSAYGGKKTVCDNTESNQIAPYTWPIWVGETGPVTKPGTCAYLVQQRCPNGLNDPCEASTGHSDGVCSLLTCVNKCDPGAGGECHYLECDDGWEEAPNPNAQKGCDSTDKCCIPSFADPDLVIIPEFSTYGIIAAIIVIAAVVFWFVKKKKK